MEKEKAKEFITADLYLSSAISIYLKTKPSYRVENRRVLFVFPLTDDLYSAMSAYNGGGSICAFEYAQTIKRLRAEMLMRRGLDEETQK